MRTLQAPAGFVKMASGAIVPASRMSAQQKQKPRKFLLVVQYYNDDAKAAEELCSLIADLERTRNHEADVLLFRRADSRELAPQIVAKLQSKFDKVVTLACRRIDARGYPFAPNQIWSDLLMLMASTPPFATDYYAFINLETDAVPTRPGWIGELIAAWKGAMAEGKAIIGAFSHDPFTHLNGLAVYSSDVYRRAGGNTLAGGSPHVCYDIRHAPTLTPMAKESPLVYFEYRKPTITPDELFAAKNGVIPALYHGVKDDSARRAVRARHISFTDKAPAAVIVHKPTADTLQVPAAQNPTSFAATEEIWDDPAPPAQALGVAASIARDESAITVGVQSVKNVPAPSPAKRPNVYTYFSSRGRASNESQAVLEAWRKGWTSRGWNPIVLTFRDAAKHTKFDAFSSALEKLPCAMDRARTSHRFNRWLALEQAGGGLLVDMDVLPDEFTPDALGDMASIHVYRETLKGRFFGAYFNKEESTKWIEAIMAYDAQPDDVFGTKPDVTDDTVLRRFHPECEIADGMVHFSASVVGNERKSVAMEKFLAGVPA